jgi:mannose-6-phosphate isomerase-like protein (cupin superfamily)
MSVDDMVRYFLLYVLTYLLTQTSIAQGNRLKMESGDPTKSAVGYLWRTLCDYPIVIGITKGVRSDHQPHFHSQAECYYVVSGRAKTLCNGEFKVLEKGDYFYIPGDTIHNTPILEEEGLSVLYWYPFDHTFSTFKYYWRPDVRSSNEATDKFDVVDELRMRDLGLGPYGTNTAAFLSRSRVTKDLLHINSPASVDSLPMLHDDHTAG